MLSVDVQKVTLMCFGGRNIFNVDVDMSKTQERTQKYTDFYILIKLSVPILINNTPKTIMIQKQFIKKVKDIHTADYILRDLIIEWPGQLDKVRLEEVLKGKATVQFFDVMGE